VAAEVRILAISGGLRAISSNTALLQAAIGLAPLDLEISLYDSLASLPHFNPDMDTVLDDPNLPPTVKELRRQIGSADGL